MRGEFAAHLGIVRGKTDYVALSLLVRQPLDESPVRELGDGIDYLFARADEVEHPPAHLALGGTGSPLDGQRGALGVAVARKARLCGARKFSDRTIGMSRIAHGGILAHTAPVRTGGDKTAFPSPFSPLSRPFSPAFAAGRGGLATGREIKCISD